MQDSNAAPVPITPASASREVELGREPNCKTVDGLPSDSERIQQEHSPPCVRGYQKKVIALVLFLLLSLVATVWLMDAIRPNDWQAIFVYAAMGCNFCSFLLPAAVAGLGPWRTTISNAVGLALLFLGLAVWLVFHDAKSELGANTGELILNATLSLLAAVVPLQLLRLMFGWRVSQQASVGESQRSFTIGGVMELTVHIALVFALLNASDRDKTEFYFILGGVMVASLLFIAAPIWSLLRHGRSFRVAYIVAIAVLYMVALWISRSYFLEPDVWRMAGFTITVVTFMCCWLGLLQILRAAGFRLQTALSPPKGT